MTNEQPRDEVFDWLKHEAQRLKIEAKFYTNLVKVDKNWLYLPVYVDGEDAFDRATILQELEEAWRNQQPEPYWELLLIPAAN